MNKFKEILFLKNLNRVGTVAINKNYIDLLNRVDNVEELINSNELPSRFTKEELYKTYEKVNTLAESIIEDSEITVVTIFDDIYPDKLKILKNKKPPILYVKGDINALSKPNLSVIGTRKPSKSSKEFEENMVKSVLDISNRAIVSGLALGCDKIAHQTTVNENKVTIAFLPSGVNVITPSSHKELANEIIEKGGCLISEYEPNKKANKYSYVQRDKLVAAFSDILFVVQCGIESGTMHTVNAFLDFNSNTEFKGDLYAYLPEDTKESDFTGNNSLIANKKGIKVTDIEDFCEQVVILGTDINKELKLKDKQITLDFK